MHGLDEDGATTAVQAGAVCDLANVLHLATRSCRQEQEHACAAEHDGEREEVAFARCRARRVLTEHV